MTCTLKTNNGYVERVTFDVSADEALFIFNAVCGIAFNEDLHPVDRTVAKRIMDAMREDADEIKERQEKGIMK